MIDAAYTDGEDGNIVFINNSTMTLYIFSDINFGSTAMTGNTKTKLNNNTSVSF